MLRKDAKVLELPFRLAEPDNVTKLVELVYYNQASGIEKEGPEGNAALLFAWSVAQGLIKTVVTLLENRNSDEDVKKIANGLKTWCKYD